MYYPPTGLKSEKGNKLWLAFNNCDARRPQALTLLSTPPFSPGRVANVNCSRKLSN